MKIDGGSLFHGVAELSVEEQFTELARGCSFRCERIVSHGHVTSPGEWLDQPDDEWVVLLTGSATLEIEGEATLRELRPGDWLLLPAHLRHRVERTDATQPTVWLAIHFQREVVG